MYFVFVDVIAAIVANTCPCVRNEIECADRCHSSKLNLLCRHDRPDYRAISFPEPLCDLSLSFTISLFPSSLVRLRDLDSRAFREWPIAIKRNETVSVEKASERKTRVKKEGQSERGIARKMMRGCEKETKRRERGKGGRGRERARASCRHLGLAFNLRASRRALIRAGSSSSYEPQLRYKQELE